jgi:hypothetical protein
LITRANMSLARRQYPAAAADAAAAEKILAPNFDASQWQMAMALSVHGAALAGLKEYPEAERKLLESLKGLASAPIPGVVAKGRQRLALLYTDWGKPEVAARYLPQ